MASKKYPRNPRMDVTAQAPFLGPLAALSAEKGKGWRTFFGQGAGAGVGVGVAKALLPIIAKGNVPLALALPSILGMGGAAGGAYISHGKNSPKVQAKIDAWHAARKAAKKKKSKQKTAAWKDGEPHRRKMFKDMKKSGKGAAKDLSAMKGELAAMLASYGATGYGLHNVLTGEDKAVMTKDPVFQKALKKMTKNFKAAGGTMTEGPKMFASYRPGAEIVMHPKKNVPITLHELGHSTAMSHKRKGTLQKLMGKFRKANMNHFYGMGKGLAPAAGMLTALSGEDKDALKRGKAGAAISGIGSLGMLGEEAAANVNAMKALKKASGGGKLGRKAMLRYVKAVGPAQGTYLAAVAAAMATPLIAGKLRRRSYEKKMLKAKKQRKS